jgi:hypothetical protein
MQRRFPANSPVDAVDRPSCRSCGRNVKEGLCHGDTGPRWFTSTIVLRVHEMPRSASHPSIGRDVLAFVEPHAIDPEISSRKANVERDGRRIDILGEDAG